MTETTYPVGYGRPSGHTPFQKGQSGNPSGKAGPKTQLKQAFKMALDDALNSDRQVLKDSRPATVMEAIARNIALKALEGRPSARKLALAELDRESPRATGQEGRSAKPAMNSEKNGIA